jgi:hypothetical protein
LGRIEMQIKSIENREISEPGVGYPIKVGDQIYYVSAGSQELAMEVARSRFSNAEIRPQSLEELASELNSTDHPFSRRDVEALARREERGVNLFVEIGKTKDLSMLEVGVSNAGAGKVIGGVFVATKYGANVRYLPEFSPAEAVFALTKVERNPGRNLSPYDLLDRLVEQHAERRAENARHKENAHEIYGEGGYKAEIRVEQGRFEIQVYSQVYQGVKDVDGVDRGGFVNDKIEDSAGSQIVNVGEVRSLLKRHRLELPEPVAQELDECATVYAFGRARTAFDRERMVTEIVDALKDISLVGRERTDSAGFAQVVGQAHKKLGTYQEGFSASGDPRVGAGALALNMIEKYALRLGALHGSNPEFSASDMRQAYKEGVETLQIMFDQGMSVSVISAVATSVCDSDHGTSFSRWQAKDLLPRFGMVADVAIGELHSLGHSGPAHDRDKADLYQPLEVQSPELHSRSEGLVQDHSMTI